MRRFFSVLMLVALSACAADEPSIPAGYNGPLARIFDSFGPPSKTSVNIFYVAEMNGRPLANSLTATRAANHGLGLTMEPVLINRQVPAGQSATFKIVGRTEYVSLALGVVGGVTGKNYEVSGETTFAPLPDHVYQVKGVLAADGLSVWIMDTGTYQVMGQRIDAAPSRGAFSSP